MVSVSHVVLAVTGLHFWLRVGRSSRARPGKTYPPETSQAAPSHGHLPVGPESVVGGSAALAPSQSVTQVAVSPSRAPSGLPPHYGRRHSGRQVAAARVVGPNRTASARRPRRYGPPRPAGGPGTWPSEAALEASSLRRIRPRRPRRREPRQELQQCAPSSWPNRDRRGRRRALRSRSPSVTPSMVDVSAVGYTRVPTGRCAWLQLLAGLTAPWPTRTRTVTVTPACECPPAGPRFRRGAHVSAINVPPQ